MLSISGQQSSLLVVICATGIDLNHFGPLSQRSLFVLICVSVIPVILKLSCRLLIFYLRLWLNLPSTVSQTFKK